MPLRRVPLFASALFYGVALFTILLPRLVQSTGTAAITWLLYTITATLYGFLTILALSHRGSADRRVILFMFTGFAVTLTLLFDAVTVPHGVSFESLAYRGAFLLTYQCNFAVIIHMASVMPRLNPITVKHQWLIPAAYTTGLVSVAVSILLYVNAHRQYLPFETPRATVSYFVSTTNHVLYLIAGAAVLMLLGHAARSDEVVERRRQALIVFCGVIPWYAYVIGSFLVRDLGRTPAGAIVEAVVVLIIPVAFVISLLRYRLFEIGLVARGMLVYTATIFVLLLAAAIMIPAVYWFSTDVLALADATVAFAVLAFVAGVTAGPLSRFVAAVIDRRFFHEKLSLRAFEQTVIAELAGFNHPTHVAEYLVVRLHNALHIRNAVLLVADEEQRFYRVAATAGDFDDEQRAHSVVVAAQELAQWLPQLARGVPFSRDPQHERGELARMLDLLHAKQIVPVKLKERLIGFIALGEPMKEWELDRHDLARLEAIARQASAMLDNARLADLALNDPVTRLPRRAGALERIEVEVKRSMRSFQPFAVAMIDLDSFKEVNDTFGHLAGDRVLRDVARRLVSESRSLDVIARYGGDEFLALFPDTPPSGALIHAENLRQRIASHAIELDDAQTVYTTVSIGVCMVAQPEDLASPAELIDRADEAMYRAKRDGKNRVVVHSRPSAAAAGSTSRIRA